MRCRARHLRALRLGLTTMALLLGVLTMHGVGGGPHALPGADHAMGAAGGGAAAAQSAVVAPVATTPTGLAPAMHVMTGFAVELGEAVVLLPQELPDDASGALTAMCVVMLLSLVLALGYGVLGLLPRRAAAPAPWRSVGGSGRPLRAPPPDLLSQLCVLRT